MIARNKNETKEIFQALYNTSLSSKNPLVNRDEKINSLNNTGNIAVETIKKSQKNILKVHYN
ncbi:hypothetical protein [Thermosipho atlanticus]|uniref:hypothetical protein n=1 Tax=Thermosipho atlanticus TaxID=238991 RepID=UPI00093531D8|nr:hypothetical protein [Thermosipho atlanticus]